MIEIKSCEVVSQTKKVIPQLKTKRIFFGMTCASPTRVDKNVPNKTMNKMTTMVINNHNYGNW